MKSLILKDYYNIRHNSRYLLLMLVFFAVMFIPTMGPEIFTVMCCVMCSTMIISTCSFDEHCKWNRYAVIMPVTRKDIVTSKFMVLAIFSVFGALLGFIVTICTSLIMDHSLSVMETLLITLVGLATALFLGGTCIPLLYKFGVEKARIMLLAVVAIPMLLFIALGKILGQQFSDLPESTVTIILCLTPVVAILWDVVMGRISLVVLRNKEL
ncbi:ABC-2 transporter permease [Aminicella lysinilytica]|uniref:ABC-2 transporter permease n=1 Tax=Aminicella lysinilytica TaxID=433323 RepID=UPI0026F26E7C|nr:ABC-2 transporter permease [Aminicella lysinilytica]